MDVQLLTECDRILTSCGRPVMPRGAAWVDVPYKMQYQKFLQGQTLAPGSSPVSTEEKIVDTEVPFVCFGVSAIAQPYTPGAVYWRLRLPTGRFLHSKQCAITEVGGFGSYRYWFDQPIVCEPGSKFYITVDSLTQSPTLAAGVSIVFEGGLRHTVRGAPADVSATAIKEACAAMARYRQNPNGNIMAPEWRLGNQCHPETPKGMVDEAFEYVTPLASLVPVPWTGEIVPNVLFPIQGSSDFIGRFFSTQSPSTTGGSATGTIAVRIRTDTGYELTDGFTIASAISTVLFPSLPLNAAGALYIDYMVVDGAGTANAVMNVQTVLCGVKRKRAAY